jgi:hypothetical protein
MQVYATSSLFSRKLYQRVDKNSEEQVKCGAEVPYMLLPYRWRKYSNGAVSSSSMCLRFSYALALQSCQNSGCSAKRSY